MNISKLLTLSLVALMLSSFSLPFQKKVSLSKSNVEKQGYSKTSYGIIPNHTFLIKSAIKPNEFLSNVFNKFNLNNNKALEVSSYGIEVFNPKVFRTGNVYAFLLEANNNKLVANKFIYEKNIVDYAMFDFNGDEIVGEVKSKPIVRKKVVSSAVIKGSLYQTLVDIDANPILAIEMADIYKWTIDFYRIQENDNFKIIYFEEFVEGKSIGEFEVEACSFEHLGIDNKAFAYQRTSSDPIEYFDEEGNTLKEFFLQAPVAYSRISSPYTMNRFHPVTGKNKPHLGTDYAAPTGTPIYSTANGVVTHAKYSKYNGNYVKVKHNDTYTTQYLHMSKIASGITPGTSVSQGQVIGYVGSTGLATGPHVCYRFWKNGKQVNPYAEDIPKAEPLELDELPTYFNYIKNLNKKLDNISLKTS